MKKTVCYLLVLAMCFSLAACALPAKTEISVSAPRPSPTATTAPRLRDAKLKGDWYGYWEMISCTGAWAEMDNSRWDCCGQIDDKDVLYLWDVDIDKETGLAKLEIKRDKDVGSVSGGWFMDNSSGYDQWRVEMREDDCGKLLVVRGNYKSERNGNFSFMVYLRPWGDKWPEKSRPERYESFFLPALEGDKSMPTSFK